MVVNIFALLKNEGKEIKRINISGNIQKELNEIISRADDFSDLQRIEFNGQYKPDDNEVLEIEEFDHALNADLDNPLNLEILKPEDINSIKAIIFNNEQYIGFQCFDTRKIIEPSRLNIVFRQDTFSKLEGRGLTISDKLDVLYVKKDKSLLFFSYHNATKVFDLNSYFREVTGPELEIFFQSPAFFDVDEELIANVDNATRKKIFLILKNGLLDKVLNNFKPVANYAQTLNLNGVFDLKRKKIVLPNDKKEFKKVISFLNEDLYRSPISDLIYESNSKKKA